MGLYARMKTSGKLESEGIWLQIEDSRIKLARAGGKNTKFIAAAEKVAREHKRSLDLMGESQAKKLFGKIYAEMIVLDWLTRMPDGDLDEDGNPAGEDVPSTERWKRCISSQDDSGKEIFLEFKYENVLKVFEDLPDLLKVIKETAEDPSLFREELLKGIEGN